jgi:hypothetical protein
VLQLERQISEEVDFYDGKKHGSVRQKASGGSRAGHSRGMPDLMQQFGVIMGEVIFLELIIVIRLLFGQLCIS